MRLLIVDDSKVMRSIIIRTLKQAGYADAVFAEAGNGIEALKAMREGAIDLMLLDWNMPDLNGIDLAEKLKTAGIKLKFGFVTTETSDEMRKRAIEAGALFLVGKPFTPESLQAALAGKAPPVKIEGDVQLAAEIGWLADNLRWDVEEDLSRLIGDAPAHTLVGAARQMLAGLRRFLAQSPAAASALVPEPPKAFP